MKNFYVSVLCTFFTLFAFAQEALITSYVDSPCPNANGRVLEIYVNGTLDLTGWNVQRQANGGDFSSNIDLSALGEVSDTFIYLTNDEAIFSSEFNITTNIIENSVISSNGDDAFQIVDNNENVIDRFGEAGVDGSNTPWVHEDAYYQRNNGSTANAGNFDVGNWTFAEENALDGLGTCNNGEALSTIISLGSYTPTTIPPTALGLGQMAFTMFNADGDDDFAMVTFTEIPANTTIYFADKEWTGTEFNSGEATYAWNSGANSIPAGTILTFYTISETPNVSHGSITGSPGGLSSGSEAIFAYLGTDEHTPTEFITAVANSSSAYGTLEGTGLVEGFTAITLPEGTDIAAYNGTRTGLDLNGYLLELNNMANFDMQDTDEDDHNDSVVPDVPANTTMFTLNANDVTAPQVVQVYGLSETEIEVIFSEDVSNASATNTANYSISPSINITSVTYDATLKTAILTHNGFTVGTEYTLTVNNIEDNAALAMEETYTSEALFFNNLNSGLIITEVMYNAPSDNSDALEFIEIYNTTENTIPLGGIKVKDEDSFIFTFPEMELASNETVLLAADKTTADAFYGVPFLDMPQGISNALGNGGEVIDILNTEGTNVFSMEYDDGDDWPLADGDGPSIELLNPAGAYNNPFNFAAATNLVGPSLGENVYASPGTFNPTTDILPTITFTESYISINENDGSATLTVEISGAPETNATIDVTVLTADSSAEEGQDYTYTNETLTFTPEGGLTQDISIAINDNDEAQNDRLIALELTNPTNANLGGSAISVIYILDNESHAPTALEELGIVYSHNYTIEGDNPGSEIVVHDAATERLFVMNSGNASVEVLDFSDPENISAITTIDLSVHGVSGTSVAVHNGIVAATAIPENDTQNGSIVFTDTDGNELASVEAGALPDMITFTPDGTKLLVANEGQPNTDYTVDPEGSISVIDLTGGIENLTQANVMNINFNAYDSQEEELKANNIRIFGPNASVSQDLEPEYITVSEDSQKAWVTLQENNAIAVIDLTTMEVTDIFPMGLKDHSLPENALDTSNEQDFIFMANWPIKGMYMPDAITNYTVNGTTYYVTANEGDAREYDALEEEINIEDITLDPTAFPNQAFLQLEENLGKINMTSENGDTDGDGDYDEIHVFGGRSFSIYNAETGAQVFDSGSDFERIIAEHPIYQAIFNTTDDENKFKNRSDNKGPEPEAVIVEQINNKFYAFIGLERVGGFMVYDITNPTAPVYEGYYNNRSTVDGQEGNEIEGDLAPESIVYISPENNATEKGLIIIANEVSATISVYTLENNILSLPSFENTNTSFIIYPNPVKNGRAFFTKPTDYILFDFQGRKIQEAKRATYISTENLTTGTYIVKSSTGESVKLMVN